MDIVLTAERCLMSNYHGALFLGFMSCAPRNLIPSKIFFNILFPPVKVKDGKAVIAPYGTRKIEAALIENGFNVTVVPPEKISKFLDKAKIIGVTTNDPLGLGPASTTFAGKYGLVKEEPYNAYCFRNLLTTLRQSKAKIAVGGAGAWQLADEKVMEELGIDIVVIGEGEKTVPELFGRILNGENLKGIFYGEVAERIPIIKGATVGGIVEIARGCGRGCKFCQPTLQRLRSRSLEDILKEAEINARVNRFVTLHAEDVLRYKAEGFRVNEEEVLKLFSSVAKISKVGISHFSLASLASAEKLIEEISNLLGIPNKEQPWLAGQTGIETGSVRLVKEYMAGKVLPFKPEDWCEIVEQAFGICSDNHWVPCATLVIGFPKETEDDVMRTIELLDRLRRYKSLVVPLFFVPLSALKDQRPFRSEDLKSYHWELMQKCWEHDLRWIRILADEYLAKMPIIPRAFLKKFIGWAVKEGEKRLKEIIKLTS
ncbi:MAG: B12-binding domain-containing radical SAM protein [Archaeoglobales archaeon]|nr:B12-binding domain-containing radical SAM protein [Archaeoglobales archaeon]